MTNKNKNGIKTFYPRSWPSNRAGEQDYELLDTGDHQKLERFGKYVFVRPYEDAFWKKSLPSKEWDKADGIFFSSKQGAKSGWKMKGKIDKKWEMSYGDIKFSASPTPFRHLGFFPEQATHWDLIEEKITEANLAMNFLKTAPSETKGQGTHTFLKNSLPDSPKRKIRFLNLFGYTGVASLFALRAGAEVTHLDASKQTIDWAKENQEASDLSALPMRVIVDDAMKFIEREIKRGNKYDCIVMDPPKFGRGPKGETWKLEENLAKLLSQVKLLLSDKPLFVILTSYATESSSLSLGYALKDIMKGFHGEVEAGELCVLEKSNKRVISLANTAIWSRDN